MTTQSDTYRAVADAHRTIASDYAREAGSLRERGEGRKAAHNARKAREHTDRATHFDRLAAEWEQRFPAPRG